VTPVSGTLDALPVAAPPRVAAWLEAAPDGPVGVLHADAAGQWSLVRFSHRRAGTSTRAAAASSSRCTGRGDSPPVHTGTRPGAKLHEELNLVDEEVKLTHHPKIKVFAGTPVSRAWMIHHLTSLGAACAARDLGALIEEMKQIVPDYTVSEDVLVRIVPLRTVDSAARTSQQRRVLWEQSLEHLRAALQPVFDTAETESLTASHHSYH